MLKCFDFECVKCGVIRKDVYVKSDEVPECAMCRQPMSKRHGGMNFVLKGPGFYATDNAAKFLD